MASVPGGQLQQQHQQADYSTWSSSSLIARISELERQLQDRNSEYNTPAVPSSLVSTTGAQQSEASTKTKYTTPTTPTQQQENAQTQQKKKRPLSPTTDEDFTHTPAPNRQLKKEAKQIDPSKYHTRFIALKFAYLGQRYNGLEHANGNLTPLPTIEEELWKALWRTRLILPTNAPGPASEELEFLQDGPLRPTRPFSLYWEGCEYSKAGRTDRGVSAFGQVVGVRVRSARPKVQKVTHKEITTQSEQQVGVEDSMLSSPKPEDDGWDDVQDELPYIHLLNRVLPEDIRVLAWCPHPPEGFDARFSCRERRYKYFFTNPAFSPTPGPVGFSRSGVRGRSTSRIREGWLDIDAMREAAKHFVGVHDFRNFCKLDTSKQIENFERIIYHADIELVDPKLNILAYAGQPGFQSLDMSSEAGNGEASDTLRASTPQVYAFTLHGSAFLWHQVRHMVSVLFLVGQGLESPSLVPELLDIAKHPSKPTYEMASDAPLVLWDCIYPDMSTDSRDDALEWIYVGDPSLAKSNKGNGKFGVGGIVDDLWSVWRQRKVDEVLAGELLDLAVSQGDPSAPMRYVPSGKLECGQKAFYGGNQARMGGKYIPVMQKRKMETVDVQNAKWLANKGQRKKMMAELDGS